MRKLPDSLRDKLKEPIGLLVDEKKLIELVKDEKHVVSIGDMVTFTLLKHGIDPSFCIVDYQIKRNEYSEEMMELIKAWGKKSVVVKNPAGCISDDLWMVIENAYECIDEGSLRIEVIGEEDLASLVAIYMAPRGVTVIYGLPNKGVLVVKSSDEYKKKAKEVLDVM